MPTTTPQKSKRAAKVEEAGRRRQESDQIKQILGLISKKSRERGQAVLKADDLTAELTRLALEARNHGATSEEIAFHVRRMDRDDRTLKPISTAMLGIMIKKHAPPAEPAGKVNVDALK
jgi:hypothetical protein